MIAIAMLVMGLIGFTFELGRFWGEERGFYECDHCDTRFRVSPRTCPCCGRKEGE